MQPVPRTTSLSELGISFTTNVLGGKLKTGETLTTLVTLATLVTLETLETHATLNTGETLELVKLYPNRPVFPELPLYIFESPFLKWTRKT